MFAASRSPTRIDLFQSSPFGKSLQDRVKLARVLVVNDQRQQRTQHAISILSWLADRSTGRDPFRTSSIPKGLKPIPLKSPNVV